MSKLAIIAALPAEAACLYNKKLNVGAPVEIHKNIFLCLSGMGHESATQAANECLALNVNGLVSWGVAGAIEKTLGSGNLILASSIVTADKTYQTSSEWQNNLLANFRNNGIKTSNGNIASCKEVCASITDKNNLLNKTGAIAVDMESAAIAEIAQCNKLDFVAIRAVADKANTSIPEAVLNHTDNLGNPKLLNFIFSCISRPSQIRDIAVLAKSYKNALSTLRKIAPELISQNFFYV